MNTKPKYGIAVDGWCKGNPGPGGYKAIDIKTGKILFNISTEYTTNNIMEFLAVVHTFMWVRKNCPANTKIYTDSKVALNWVRQNKCKTWTDTSKHIRLHNSILKAEKWLKSNIHPTILKWETKLWGENPADFGHK